MSINHISKEEFESLNIAKTNLGLYSERSWLKSSDLDIAGAVIKDNIDKDWSYAILAKDADGIYRFIDGEVSLSTQEEAESKIFSEMVKINDKGIYEEELYLEQGNFNLSETQVVISNIDNEIKNYFKKNPEKMYDLSPRKFEELVASILKDMGFDIELTQATRDGGRDIIAYVRNSVSSYLTHIECKKYSPENKVGVGIIREVMGVHQIRQATKSIIVTTGFFTNDAIQEARMVENHLDLKDFNDLKSWLQRY